jgi:hypothetical protein
MTTTVLINDITVDTELQARVRMNEPVLQEYAALLMEGVNFPPVVLFDDGVKKYLVDGFHRVYAAKRVGRDRMQAELHRGSKHEGFMYSLRANAAHGLQRTNEDKRHGVLKLLEDFEYSDKSDREIAALCAVSHTFVARIRAGMKTASVRKPNLMAKPVNPVIKAPSEVATLPPEEEYDQRDDVLLELAEANEALTDRLSIQTMDATDEEKALAAETIASLREENRILTNQCNSLTHSRNTYQHKAAEAIKQCDIYRNVIKKLNKQVEQLQAKLNSHPPQEEPVPF